MIKLLWIDDNLDHDLTEKRMAILMEDDIDAHFARDASEAYSRLCHETFDVVIFDLRLPPGADDMWNAWRNEEFEKYGFALLSIVSDALDSRFQHLKTARFGVFSYESPEENRKLFDPPIRLRDNNYAMKTDSYRENDFIEFVRNVHQS